MDASDLRERQRFDSTLNWNHLIWFAAFLATLVGAGWTVANWQATFERSLADQSQKFTTTLSAQETALKLAQSDLKRLQDDLAKVSRDLDDNRKTTSLSLQNVTDRLTDIRLSISNINPVSGQRR